MTAYETALEVSRVAAEAMFKAQDAYRAKLIDDAEYMVAVRANREANAAFDIAYAAECERVEAEEANPVADIDDSQFALAI